MKKYSFVVLFFIVLQASAQNSYVLKGSFSTAKETEIRLNTFTVGCTEGKFTQFPSLKESATI